MSVRRVVVVVVAAVSVAGCGASAARTTAIDPSQGPSVGSVQDNASRLAALDGGKFTPSLYAAGIESLQPVCTEDPTGIAGLAEAGYTDLTRNGITTDTRLGVLGELRESIPAGTAPQPCDGVLAEYLTLREAKG